jgi:hypothetical protein
MKLPRFMGGGSQQAKLRATKVELDWFLSLYVSSKLCYVVLQNAFFNFKKFNDEMKRFH